MNRLNRRFRKLIRQVNLNNLKTEQIHIKTHIAAIGIAKSWTVTEFQTMVN